MNESNLLACIAQRFRATRRPRRGSIYVAVLGVAMIVSMVGLSAMHVARIELRSAAAKRDLDQARLAAQSAVEFGMSDLLLNTSWRTDATHNVEVLNKAMDLDGSTLNYKYVDTIDSDLANNTTDPVELHGIGRAGNAIFIYKVTCQQNGSGNMEVVPGSWERTSL